MSKNRVPKYRKWKNNSKIKERKIQSTNNRNMNIQLSIMERRNKKTIKETDDLSNTMHPVDPMDMYRPFNPETEK
jgi:hypothetical protein